MDMTINAGAFIIALISFVLGGIAVGAGFIAFMMKREDRNRAIEKMCIFALQRTGNIYKKLGMEERYTDDLMRLMVAARITPQYSESVTNG